MKIENLKVVSATYELYLADENGQEEMYEKTTEEAPLVWCQGEGMMLPAFEKAMEGKAVGETFDFVIPFADAYGPYEEEGLMELPKKMFFNGDGEFDEERVFVGNIIPMNTTDGQVIKAQVVEITDEMVTIDLNHPRAGQDLHYVGTVVESREATNDEITGRLNMMSGEGCGCGCCGSDCGGDCGGGHDSGCGCGHCH